jgi:hypothetical protein
MRKNTLETRRNKKKEKKQAVIHKKQANLDNSVSICAIKNQSNNKNRGSGREPSKFPANNKANISHRSVPDKP